MLKVLIAVDGSAAAKRAVEAVASLARSGSAEIQVTLLNAMEMPIVIGDLPVFDFDELGRSLKRKQDETLSNAAALAEGLGLNVVATLGVVGTPGREIVSVANEAQADQIAMGSHGLSAPDGDMLGSVALRVLQMAPVPVLMTK